MEIRRDINFTGLETHKPIETGRQLELEFSQTTVTDGFSKSADAVPAELADKAKLASLKQEISNQSGISLFKSVSSGCGASSATPSTGCGASSSGHSHTERRGSSLLQRIRQFRNNISSKLPYTGCGGGSSKPPSSGCGGGSYAKPPISGGDAPKPPSTGCGGSPKPPVISGGNSHYKPSSIGCGGAPNPRPSTGC